MIDFDLISAIFRTYVDIKFAKMNIERRYSLIISAKIMNLKSSGKNESKKANTKKCSDPFDNPHITYVRFASGLDGKRALTDVKKMIHSELVINIKYNIFRHFPVGSAFKFKYNLPM